MIKLECCKKILLYVGRANRRFLFKCQVCGMVYGFTKSQLSKGGNYEQGK